MKQNSKRQAGAKADSSTEMSACVQSADIAQIHLLYAVLKLNTEIELTNPFTGKREDAKLGGIAGYIPVFSTIEEAEVSSQNGKYKILAISPA